MKIAAEEVTPFHVNEEYRYIIASSRMKAPSRHVERTWDWGPMLAFCREHGIHPFYWLRFRIQVANATDDYTSWAIRPGPKTMVPRDPSHLLSLFREWGQGGQYYHYLGRWTVPPDPDELSPTGERLKGIWLTLGAEQNCQTDPDTEWSPRSPFCKSCKILAACTWGADAGS